MISEKVRNQMDPLGEKKVTVGNGLIYRYKNRILLALTEKCASECSFCYRKWQREEKESFAMISKKDIDYAIDYIKSHKEIEEVILSGGDPLMNFELLKYALEVFDKSKQIKVIRIHTRAVVVKPELVTKEIEKIFKNVKNCVLFVSLHVNHPSELNKQAVEKIIKIRKTGAILFSQSVFLKGVNDSAETLSELFTKLLQLGVRPYNIYHCSYVKGAEHFIVPIEKEIEIMTEVKKKVSGLAFPTLIVDTPGTAGKIPVPLNFWKFELKSYVDYEGNEFSEF